MQNFCVIENGQLSNNFQEYIQVSGAFNYFVCIEIKRKPGTTNSSIAITPFSKPDRNLAIAAKYRWLQISNEAQYNLNMTANFYQLSPRDIERVVEATVFPFEDGFEGECKIRYGPILLDPVVQNRLSEAVRQNFLEITCEGGSRRSSFPFDIVRADNEEMQCYDRRHSKLVDTVRITKEVITDPSQVDSLQMRVVAPGNEVIVKTKSHDDRDLLILFMQYMIMVKTSGQPVGAASSPEDLFGAPMRVPNQLDESQLYDPRTIQFNPRKSIPKNSRETSLLAPPFAGNQSIIGPTYPQTQMINFVPEQREFRDSFVTVADTSVIGVTPVPALPMIPVKTQTNVVNVQPVQEQVMLVQPPQAIIQPTRVKESELLIPIAPPPPPPPTTVTVPVKVIPEEFLINMDIMKKELDKVRLANEGLARELEVARASLRPGPGSPPYDLVVMENSKLKVRNQTLLNENEFLRKQNQELMVDHDVMNIEADKVYRRQVDMLTAKLKEHRVRAKELEGLLLDGEGKRVENIKIIEERTREMNRLGFELNNCKGRLENAERGLNYFQNKLKELEQHHGTVLVDLSKVRGENTRIPGLEQRIKQLEGSVATVVAEKADLCTLINSLREQLNDMETEKTDANNDEKLMGEKLKFVVKEKDILNQKIKNLEGLYRSELGEIQHAEQVLQEIKKVQMELEVANKEIQAFKREKAELLAILQGTKDQLSNIENQRDHFEDKFDQVNEELQRERALHQELVATQGLRENIVGEAKRESNNLAAQLELVRRENIILQDENKDLQDRIEEHLQRLLLVESENQKKAQPIPVQQDLFATPTSQRESRHIHNSIDHIKEMEARRSIAELSISWTDLENILKYKCNMEIPDGTDPQSLVDCVDHLADSIAEIKTNVSELQNQVINLRADKIDLLERLETSRESVDTMKRTQQITVVEKPDPKTKITSEVENAFQTLKLDLGRKAQEIDIRNEAIRELNRKLTELMTENRDLKDQQLDNSKLSHQSNPYTGVEVGKLTELNNLRMENTTLKQEMLGLKHKLNFLDQNQQSIQQLQIENSELKQKAETIGKQLLTQMSAGSNNSVEVEKLKLDNTFLKQNLEVLKNQIVSLSSDSQSIQGELDRLRQANRQMAKDAAGNDATIQSLKRQLELLETQKSTAVEQLNKANEEITLKSKGIEDAKAAIVEHIGQFGAKDLMIASLREEVEKLKTTNLSLSTHGGHLEEAQNLRLEISSLKQQNIETKLKMDDISSLLKQAQDNEKRLEQDNLLLKSEKRTLQDLVQELQTKVYSTVENEKATKKELDVVKRDLQNIVLQKALAENVAEEAQSEVNDARHYSEMTKMENEGLKMELERVKLILEQMSSPKNETQPNPKFSAINYKLLEDQVNILNQENSRLRQEKNQAIVDGERLRLTEDKNRDLREEISMLKDRNLYLESELKEKMKHNVVADSANDDMVRKLREEIRQLREKEVKRGPVASESPVLEHYNNVERGSSQASTPSKNFDFDIEKLQSQLKEKNLRIEALEDRIDNLTSELEKAHEAQISLKQSFHSNYSNEKVNVAQSQIETIAKKENIQLRDRIRILEDRERQLLDSELEKDTLITLLKDRLAQAKENNNNLSIGLDASGFGVSNLSLDNDNPSMPIKSAKLTPSATKQVLVASTSKDSHVGPRRGSDGHAAAAESANLIATLRSEIQEKEVIIESLTNDLQEATRRIGELEDELDEKEEELEKMTKEKDVLLHELLGSGVSLS